MPLEEYLKTENALIAPNYQEHECEILAALREIDGNNHQKVLIEKEELEESSQTAFILSKAPLDEISKIGASIHAEVSRLKKKDAERIINDTLSDNSHLYILVWD